MGHNGGLAVTLQGQAQQGGPAAVPTGGRRENYDDHARAALKGFSNVPLDGGVKGIWGRFQASKKTQTHRQILKRKMEGWAKSKGIAIHEGFHLSKTVVDDLVDIKFNPGGAVVVYDSAEMGISPLLCLPKKSTEVERELMQEDADRMSEGTRTKTVALRLRKTNTRSPSQNYYEMKLMVGTYASFLFSGFGHRCPLYMNVLALYRMLDYEVM